MNAELSTHHSRFLVKYTGFIKHCQGCVTLIPRGFILLALIFPFTHTHTHTKYWKSDLSEKPIFVTSLLSDTKHMRTYHTVKIIPEPEDEQKYLI